VRLDNWITIAKAKLVPGSEVILSISQGSVHPRAFLMEPPLKRKVTKCHIKRMKSGIVPLVMLIHTQYELMITGVKRMAPQYELYLEDDYDASETSSSAIAGDGEWKRKAGDMLMVARKKLSLNEKTTYFISSAPKRNEKTTGDVPRSDPSFLGDVQSNFLGTEWSINGHVLHNADDREQMGMFETCNAHT
jgi:hypothetical protein